jgi:hypothetical protein
VVSVTRRVKGQAKAEDLESKTALRKLCAEAHLTLEIFTADGDPQYDQTHSIQESFNDTIFISLEAKPTTRKFRIVCDPLHILKRARYHTQNEIQW